MAVIMNDVYFGNKGYLISTDNNLIDLDAVYDYLANQSYWAKGLLEIVFRKSVNNSLCFGIYKDGKQAGFARVVTDKATFAYLCDVFVLPAFRGIGLSKWLVQTIMAHPDLQDLRRWSLATADAHGLYKQFGFTEINNPERWMQIFTPYKVN